MSGSIQLLCLCCHGMNRDSFTFTLAPYTRRIIYFINFDYVQSEGKPYTVKPRFAIASDHEQFGLRTNFPNTKYLGWNTVSRVTSTQAINIVGKKKQKKEKESPSKPLQPTRKETNWETKETMERAAVTLETERVKWPNPGCLWWWQFNK